MDARHALCFIDCPWTPQMTLNPGPGSLCIAGDAQALATTAEVCNSVLTGSRLSRGQFAVCVVRGDGVRFTPLRCSGACVSQRGDAMVVSKNTLVHRSRCTKFLCIASDAQSWYKFYAVSTGSGAIFFARETPWWVTRFRMCLASPQVALSHQSLFLSWSSISYHCPWALARFLTHYMWHIIDVTTISPFLVFLGMNRIYRAIQSILLHQSTVINVSVTWKLVCLSELAFIISIWQPHVFLSDVNQYMTHFWRQMRLWWAAPIPFTLFNPI